MKSNRRYRLQIGMELNSEGSSKYGLHIVIDVDQCPDYGQRETSCVSQTVYLNLLSLSSICKTAPRVQKFKRLEAAENQPLTALIE